MGDAAAPEHPMGTDRRRWPAAIGAILLVAGLAIAGLALTGVLDRGSGEVRVGKLVASDLPTTAAAGTGASSPATTTTAGTEAPSWPAAVQGRPDALGDQGAPPPADGGGLAEGIYLWSDFKGWHLWIVGGGSEDGASVQADAPLTPTAVGGAVVDPAGDRFAMTRASAADRIAGVDFEVGLYTTHVVVTVDGSLPLHTGASAAAATSPLDLRYEPGG